MRARTYAHYVTQLLPPGHEHSATGATNRWRKTQEDFVHGLRIGRHAAATLVFGVLAATTAHAQDTAPPKVISQAELRKEKAPSTAPRASRADVDFFQGMIPHHAQAVIMASQAASHGARDDIRVLCERIVVGQGDEIALMQYWLRTHGESVPDAKSTKMKMKGMDMEMLMPGMLTDAQMVALDKARGSEWDRLFLEGMIGHHEGAVAMVNDLLNSHDPANDDLVYKMASDVYADQTTEIERMTKMLATVPGAKQP
jgi:uncharacterized protein (DUF305 family)